MRRMVDTVGSASVAVAVAKDGRIIFEEAIGWANREKRITATPNTIYGMASISKPITATGLMVLAERGRIDIDKPVNAYLGAAKLAGLGGDPDGATVRRVLSHTAGLPLHSHFFYADRGYSPPTMDETIRRYGILVFPPGRVYEYSNLGFGIISYLIERVSGKPFGEFMRTEVFAPLGLTHTAIDFPRGLDHLLAERYNYDERPLPFFTFDHVGASSVYSSAHDLVRFAMFHLKNHLADQRAILADTTIDEMHTIVPPSVDYGLGFSVRDGGYRVAHSGGMPGASTLMILYPTRNMALVILANTATRQAAVAQEFAIAREISIAVLPEDSAAALRGPRPSSPPPFVVSPALAGDWSGTVRTYDGTLPMRLPVKSPRTRTSIGCTFHSARTPS